MRNMKVLTLGEVMLRLSTPFNNRIEQSGCFDVTYGGAEANVAATIASLGGESRFVTALPDNKLGNAALMHLKKAGIEVGSIVRSGNRLGIYYLETGAALRPSVVIYDRADSAFSEHPLEDYDMEKCFDSVGWFHFSGITPALSENALNVTRGFLKYAKEVKGIPVSVDLNYRKKLWSKKDATSVMSSLMQHVDVIAGNEEDAYNMLGIEPAENGVNISIYDRYKIVSEKIFAKYKPSIILTSIRESICADTNVWSGVLFDGDKYHISRKYDLNGIIDRIGAGDAFTGGFIYNYFIKSGTKPESLEFAVAASALKHTVRGDFNLVTEQEVLSVANGEVSGRVQR